MATDAMRVVSLVTYAVGLLLPDVAANAHQRMNASHRRDTPRQRDVDGAGGLPRRL